MRDCSLAGETRRDRKQGFSSARAGDGNEGTTDENKKEEETAAEVKN